MSKSVIAVTLVVLGVYLAFTIVALALHDWDPLWFVWLGERYANLDPAGRLGYDGQFVYYIARDGWGAIPHLDNPAWRLQRILLPLVTRVLSLGQPGLIPWTLILINLAAVGASAYALSRWLDSQKISPWYTLTYSLFVGLLLAYSRDLTEPLTFCLGTWGTALWLQRKTAPAVVLFALGTLTRETALLIPFALGLAQLARKDLGRAWAVSTSIVPLLLWEGYLLARFRVVPFQVGPSMGLIPLGGSLPYLNLDPGRLSAFALVGVPSVLGAIFSIVYLIRDSRHETVWLLLVQSIFMSLMPFVLYEHIMGAGRIAVGLVMAVLFVFPLLTERVRQAILLYWVAPTFVWLIPILRWAPWLAKI